MRTWDDLLQDMGYARRRAQRFWRGRRPSRMELRSFHFLFQIIKLRSIKKLSECNP